jgi:hypothetical protein
MKLLTSVRPRRAHALDGAAVSQAAQVFGDEIRVTPLSFTQ